MDDGALVEEVGGFGGFTGDGGAAGADGGLDFCAGEGGDVGGKEFIETEALVLGFDGEDDCVGVQHGVWGRLAVCVGGGKWNVVYGGGGMEKAWGSA